MALKTIDRRAPGPTGGPASVAARTLEGTVVRTISGFYEVATAEGPRLAALRSTLRGAAGVARVVSRGRMRARAETLEPVVVGDRVIVRPSDSPGGRDWIEQVLPRERELTRRAAGERRPVGQTLVANVDQVIAVFSTRDPEPKLGLVDRFLVTAESQEIPALVCLNKIDLAPAEETLRGFAELEAVGYPLLCVSARTGEGMERLRERLAGRTSALVGPSGVGKSSLLNALQPGLRLKIGAVSTAVHKRRHTTRYAQLLSLDAGGYVVDTPGLREFGLWSVDPENVDDCFPEFRPLLGQCRFPDCDHLSPEGCAIRPAVDDGRIAERRYDSYVRLRADADVEQSLHRGWR
jgi:ribosome biogenesis GTPase